MQGSDNLGRWHCLRLTLAVILVLGAAFEGQAADGPDQFGNFISTGTFRFWNQSSHCDGEANYPILGRVNLADNNSPIPKDRVYLLYHNFHNALNQSLSDAAGTTLGRRNLSLNQYSFGAEKTFCDGLWSVELRMPILGNADTLFTNGFGISSARLGNLSVVGKRLLYDSPTLSVAAGLGFTLPTGDDARFRIGDDVFTLRNQAVQALPFVGFLTTPQERTFYQGFVQLGLPLGGNEIEYVNAARGAGTVDMGRMSDQSVLFLSTSAGFWMYRDQESRHITGVAPMLELHYVTALENAQQATGLGGTTRFQFGQPRQRFDVVNMTIALHTEYRNQTLFRIAGVVPITSGDNKFFDSEIQLSLFYTF